MKPIIALLLISVASAQTTTGTGKAAPKMTSLVTFDDKYCYYNNGSHEAKRGSCWQEIEDKSTPKKAKHKPPVKKKADPLDSALYSCDGGGYVSNPASCDDPESIRRIEPVKCTSCGETPTYPRPLHGYKWEWDGHAYRRNHDWVPEEAPDRPEVYLAGPTPCNPPSCSNVPRPALQIDGLFVLPPALDSKHSDESGGDPVGPKWRGRYPEAPSGYWKVDPPTLVYGAVAVPLQSYNPHQRVTMKQIEDATDHGNHPTCMLVIQGECWIEIDPVPVEKGAK